MTDMKNETSTYPTSGREPGSQRKRKMKRAKRKLRIMQITIVLLMIIIAVLSGILIYHLFRKNAFLSGSSAGTGGNVPVTAQTDTASMNPSGTDTSQADVLPPETSSAGEQAGSLIQTPETEQTAAPETDQPAPAQTAAGSDSQSEMDQAAILAAGYDYDGAIDLLKAVPGYENSTDIMSLISSYEQQRDACVAADVNTVPHIFYHSLVNEPDIAFNADILGNCSEYSADTSLL